MIRGFFEAIQTNSFLQSALIASFFASIASGVMGSFVVVKKISSISGSISHSVLGGVGFCLFLQYNLNYLWADPLYGAFFVALIAAFIIGYVHTHYRQKEDALIASVWSIGMAIGVIFISFIKGYKADFSNYLFGNILLVKNLHLLLLFLFDLIILAITYLQYRKFLAICFDEEGARLQKIPVTGLYFLLLSLIAITVVLLMQIIGIILVIALLAIPPTIASAYTKKLPKIMFFAFSISLLSSFLGIAIAYTLNLPPGPAIALIITLFYLLSLSKQNHSPLESTP